MAETEALINQARVLGETLARHPIVRSYAEAQRAMRADDEALRLFQDYQWQADRIRQLEAENLAVSDAERHKLQQLQSRFASNPSLKALMRAQADFIHFTNQVHQALEAPLNAQLNPENPA